MLRLLAVATALVWTLGFAAATHAAPTAEQKCEKGRYDAAAKYAACQHKATGKFEAGGTLEKYQVAASKCRVAYARTWPKLQSRAAGTGSLCDRERFQDFGNAIVDFLTGLTWEKKDDDGGLHDVEGIYTWSLSNDGANGSAFEDFLEPLNAAPCDFTGYCDWRLPTSAELQTLLVEPYPCTTSPCVDPLFVPTGAFYVAAPSRFHAPTTLWAVSFVDGELGTVSVAGALYFFRAVRGGL